MKSTSRCIQGFFALSLGLASTSACDEGASEPDAVDETDGAGGKGDDLDASAERRDVMGAIHTDFIDAAVRGQANELLVSEYQVAGNHAWVQAKVQAPGGGEIDWRNSDYADLLDSGLFDGPYLAALLENDGEGWEVVTADVGATDVWWDLLWERFPISCGLFPEDTRCFDVAEPAFGTPERKAITGAIHDQFLDEQLNEQPNELVISWLRAGAGYAFLQADVQGKGGTEIDWSDTYYAEEVEEGLFDGPRMEVFLTLEGGEWLVQHHAIGATDVWWWGLWDASTFDDAPCALFDVQECVPDY